MSEFPSPFYVGKGLFMMDIFNDDNGEERGVFDG